MKERKSKLDPYAKTLQAMDEEKKTLEEIQAWLKEEGVTVVSSTLSRFLESLRQARLQKQLLAQISTGARQCREVEKQFGKNPAPELETLIKLHRVLILQLSTQGNADPKFLALANNLLQTAMEYTSGQTKARFKERELKLAEEKFQFDAAEACLKTLPELKVISSDKGLSQAQKVDRIRQKLFGVLPK